MQHPIALATLSLAAGVLLCTGCTADSGGHATRDVLRGDVRGPLAVPVDSVLLEETGRFYIGNPFSLVPDTTDGSFLISDFSDGATAVIHHDAGLEGELPHGTITADIYLTVTAPDRKTACVDALVPHFKAMRPIQTVERDTIFLLDRRLNEEEDGLESWVRMYRIDTSQCTWLKMD